MEDFTKIKAIEFLGPECLNPEDIRCPKCDVTNIVISGKVFNNFIEEIVDDTSSRTVFDETIEEIDKIVCMSCQTCYIMVTQHVYDLIHKDDDFLEELGIKR